MEENGTPNPIEDDVNVVEEDIDDVPPQEQIEDILITWMVKEMEQKKKIVSSLKINCSWGFLLAFIVLFDTFEFVV